MSVEERLTRIEERLSKLEKLLTGKKPAVSGSPKSDNLEELIVNNIEDIGQQNLVVLCLKMKPQQTKSQIESMFKELGKETGNWFNGSNFNRLIRKGIIKEDGLTEKNLQLYSLTKKGDTITAAKIIDKMRLGEKSA